MSNQSIYTQLVSAGLSPAGACALMGNMNAESAMRANNAQDGMTRYSDAEYTTYVDNGTYTRFATDGVGYGLCQWTYHARKENLLAFAKSRGVSIGNEAMQVDFAVKELKSDNSGLWAYLCGTPDIYTATERICKEFERPAVNNISVRYTAAMAFYSQFSALSVSADKTPTATAKDTPTVAVWPPRVLAEGMTGADVYVLQAALLAHGQKIAKIDGKFGSETASQLKAYQKANSLTADGIAGNKTWTKILSR